MKTRIFNAQCKVPLNQWYPTPLKEHLDWYHTYEALMLKVFRINLSEIKIKELPLLPIRKKMFSKACEYGIRATIYIAMQSKDGNRVSLKDIADQINSPVAFTAKILQVLARHHVVDSAKGPAGGFEIAPSIKLSQIVFAIDGDNIYKGCGLGLPKCSAVRPCPVHGRFARIRDDLRYMLENTSILELAEGTLEGVTFLKR